MGDATMNYRYLVYSITTDQSSPILTNIPPPEPEHPDDEEDTSTGVVVDLHEQRRFFRGEWEPVDTDNALWKPVEVK